MIARRTMKRTTTKKKKARSRSWNPAVLKEAAELVENIQRMKRDGIPILPHHPPLH